MGKPKSSGTRTYRCKCGYKDWTTQGFDDHLKTCKLHQEEVAVRRSLPRCWNCGTVKKLIMSVCSKCGRFDVPESLVTMKVIDKVAGSVLADARDLKNFDRWAKGNQYRSFNSDDD